jgi:6-pyruvoyltetrahydropterin/6-carboxytetrahydropterin synthase
MYTVKVQLEFSAAHTIRGYDGICSRPHGHNWKVVVEAATPKLDSLGMSIDFFALQRATQDIIDIYDHRDMNEISPFDTLNPTSENIAKFFFDELTKKLADPVRIGSVTIFETDAYSATYTEE